MCRRAHRYLDQVGVAAFRGALHPLHGLAANETSLHIPMPSGHFEGGGQCICTKVLAPSWRVGVKIRVYLEVEVEEAGNGFSYLERGATIYAANLSLRPVC